MPAYLDYAATTPVDPRVAEAVLHYMTREFGNPHSRTHEWGTRASKAVARAREQIAAVVDADPAEVVFTSGATESNNLALLGLASVLRDAGRAHVVSTQIEHKAVLEPLQELERLGFEVTLVPPRADGVVPVEAILERIRPDTGLVSVMHVNNETGVLQPLAEVAAQLGDHPAYLHTDAAQGFGKDLEPLTCRRVDLISASGHKLFAPKGVGALIARRRGHSRLPIHPRQVGGGQERGFRSGTVAAPLVVGFGLAAELAVSEQGERAAACRATREQVFQLLSALGARVNSGDAQALPHIVSFRLPGIDAEAALICLRQLVAAATGSACTSSQFEPSHVLLAQGLSTQEACECMRWSWSHLDAQLDAEAVVAALRDLQPAGQHLPEAPGAPTNQDGKGPAQIARTGP